jgi:hypothetical protein
LSHLQTFSVLHALTSQGYAQFAGTKRRRPNNYQMQVLHLSSPLDSSSGHVPQLQILVTHAQLELLAPIKHV